MKTQTIASAAIWTALLTLVSAPVSAHPLHDHDENGQAIIGYDATVKPPVVVAALGAGGGGAAANEPSAAAVFAPFAPKVKTHWDQQFFYVESDGMPAHRMMVGITAWQQQVPLPQKYYGENAWRFPLQPVVAANPLSAKDHFFRGAIAIAANGVPIFNPIKNDGHTDTLLAGELDEFGGHAGRADDYHYHIAPLHLQSVVGPGQPVAYALDGYAIYGLTEPDGAPVAGLDAFNGHTTPALGYHYHATKNYPYLNGGFHGEVVEREGQVDPQPRAQGVRAATTPLRGAKITGFTSPKPNSYALEYQVGGETRAVNYDVHADGSATFTFIDGAGKARTENYAGRAPAGGSKEDRPARKQGDKQGKGERVAAAPREEKAGAQARQPWLKVHAKEMDANKDGTLTREELTEEVGRVFAGYDQNHDGKLTAAEHAGAGGVRSAMGGFVKQHAEEIDANGDGIITREELQKTAERMFEKTDGNQDGRLSPDETALPPGYQATPPEGRGTKKRQS